MTPRKLSPESLERSALHHLARYSTTVAQLRRVLVRKVDRALRAHPGDRSEALRWVDDLVKKLAQRRLVDDRAYAESKARSLRAAGRSGRAIAFKLRTKGVTADLASRSLAEATADVSEEAAARIFARKRRLGPFRTDQATRQQNRQRDLAALARAGFSFSVSRGVIESAAPEPARGVDPEDQGESAPPRARKPVEQPPR